MSGFYFKKVKGSGPKENSLVNSAKVANIRNYFSAIVIIRLILWPNVITLSGFYGNKLKGSGLQLNFLVNSPKVADIRKYYSILLSFG